MKKLSLKKVCLETGLLPNKIEELVERGEFPRPKKVWSMEQIFEWYEDDSHCGHTECVVGEDDPHIQRMDAALWLKRNGYRTERYCWDRELCEKLAAEHEEWRSELKRQLAEAEPELHPSKPVEKGSNAA